MQKDFSHIKTWLLDMDGVKYDHTTFVIPQFWKTFATYIRDHVPALHGAPLESTFFAYVRKHGAIHRAMAIEHNVDIPHFLEKIHDFDLSPQQADPAVVSGIARLPGDKITFTNAPRDFAHRMLAQLGVMPFIKDVFPLESMGFDTPKPFIEAYLGVIAAHKLDPRTTAFVEDTAGNLEPAKRLGITTIHLHHGKPVSAPHIDHSFPTIRELIAVAAEPVILPQRTIAIISNKIK